MISSWTSNCRSAFLRTLDLGYWIIAPRSEKVLLDGLTQHADGTSLSHAPHLSVPASRAEPLKQKYTAGVDFRLASPCDRLANPRQA